MNPKHPQSSKKPSCNFIFITERIKLSKYIYIKLTIYYENNGGIKSAKMYLVNYYNINNRVTIEKK